ncbi:hypothetical protein SLEP1_g19728 [Rubroshorea leprosula]|uniref:Uncharacterized protein n=1 Tax=Rubroshorea leprosula TaxID=152421 RepID=A0AAV5J6B0_9ROSI|nr:hypothetical protein SLEP1_g19728 [Rubroshorea leprosula]
MHAPMFIPSLYQNQTMQKQRRTLACKRDNGKGNQRKKLSWFL